MGSTGLFHRAHYNIIAAQIKTEYTTVAANRSIGGSRTLDNLAVSFAKRLLKDDPSFDPILFLNNCTPDEFTYKLSELWTDEHS